MPSITEIINSHKSGNEPAKTAAQKNSGSSITDIINSHKGDTSSKEVKPARKPGEIQALGAGSYGADKETRTDKVIKGAAQSTAASYINTAGTLSGGTGELSMGESAQAALKGQNQQKLEAEKKQRQNEKIQNKLYKKADALAEKSAKNIEEAKKGLGTVGQILVDAGVAGTQMLGDAALNIVAPGAGIVGMGLRSFGSGAQEQRQKGGSETDQFLAGLKSAGIEVLTEKIGGPFEKIYGKSFIGKAVNEGVEKLSKSGALAGVLKVVANGGQEALEEIIADVLNPLADRALNLDGKRGSGEAVITKDDVNGMIRDGIVGGILGMVGAGGQVIGESAARNQSKAQAQEAAASEAASTDTARSTNPVVAAIRDSQSQQAPAVTATTEQTEAGKPITPLDAVVRTAKGGAEQLGDNGGINTQAQAENGLEIENSNSFIGEEQEKVADIETAPSQNELPQGMGAASAEFTGEMTPAEQWVAEAQGKGDSALHPISETAQQNLAEQQGRAPEEIPKVDVNGKLTSKTANTIQNSGVTPQQMSDAITEDYYKGRYSYMKYPDQAALDKANSDIEYAGWDNALAKYKSEVAKGKVSKDITVMGIALYNQAVTNGDFVTAMGIVDNIVKSSRDAAQAMQALNILNSLSPDSRLYAVGKSIDNINQELKDRYGDKAPDIEVDQNLFDKYADALKNGDEEAVEKAWADIEQNIADQIPADWVDKLNAWRYLAMLGNPRTHIRNIFGNGGFMPVVMLKNFVGAGIESVAIKDGERTKAVFNPFSAEGKALWAAAWSDYQNASEQILSGGKFDDNYSSVNDKRTIFTTLKNVEGARKLNSNMLNREDEWFAQPHYAMALAGYLKANGISAKDFMDGTISAEVANKARAYAIKEAQKATYRDVNNFSSFVSSLGKTNYKAVNALVEGVLPFKKTPANIAKRAVEYSPIELVKTVAVDSKKLKTGEMTPSEYIDKISSGIVGTGLLGLGALLAKSGVLYGGADDDEKQEYFEQLQGKQNYSILLGDGTTVTLDWLAPEAMPLFVGVELWKSWTDNGGGFEEFLSSIGSLGQPMLEMSMLQSVGDLIDNLSYAKKSKGIYKLVAGMAANYVSQFLPTSFGQIERVFETQREQTFIDRSESAPSSNLQYFWGKLMNKNPFFDYNQIPYIDAWGRTEETGSVGERIVNNLANPAYVKKSGETAVDTELERLYKLGETDVYPAKAGTDTKVNGEYLTAEQYTKYAEMRGKTSLDGISKLVNTQAYRSMSDADKAKAISDVYDYADGVAKLAVNPNADVSKWVVSAEQSNNPAQYIADRSVMSDADTNSDKLKALLEAGYSGTQLTNKVREYMTSDKGNNAAADFLEKAQSANVSDSVAIGLYEKYNTTHNIEGGATKKEQIKDYINSLPLSSEQKSALYYSLYKK